MECSVQNCRHFLYFSKKIQELSLSKMIIHCIDFLVPVFFWSDIVTKPVSKLVSYIKLEFSRPMNREFQSLRVTNAKIRVP